MKYFFSALYFFALINCNFISSNQPKSPPVSSPDAVLLDTTYYPGKTIYELIAIKDKVRHGSYLSFTDKGDTLIYGQYSNGLREGKWLLLHQNEKLADAQNPLKQFGYNAHSFFEPFGGSFEFSHDSIKKISILTWNKKNPKQLKSMQETVYGKDTGSTDKSWYENGVLAQIMRSDSKGLLNDTTWGWRTDGTLDKIQLCKHGRMIVTKKYDETGTKIIKEERGQ